MSEAEPIAGLLTRAEPQRSAQAPQGADVVVDDSGVRPLYGSFLRVTATAEEVILDFGLNAHPVASGCQNVKAVERIVMNLFMAKRLLTAMGMTIQRHEQTFGAFELDARRRVHLSQA